MAGNGSIIVGTVAGAVVLVLLGWLPVLGALIAGIVAGHLAKGWLRGAFAGLLAGILGFFVLEFVLTGIGGALAGSIGALGGGVLGGIIGILEIGNVPLAAIGGLIGGILTSRTPSKCGCRAKTNLSVLALAFPAWLGGWVHLA